MPRLSTISLLLAVCLCSAFVAARPAHADAPLSPTSSWSSTESGAMWGVAWGDWDGDGDLDLAAANSSSPNRVYRNDGGVLALAWSSPEPDQTLGLAWGDWDGDGDLDLATANVNGPNRVYRNDGGTLISAWTSPFDEFGQARSVAWGDWDGDGDLDLVVGNWGQPNRVYRNDGGTLTSAWTSPESDDTFSVAWGDWDRDGDLDLAAGNRSQPNRVYSNDGGTLTLAWSSAESDETISVAWGDWDGDGDLDLAAGNINAPSRVYRNDGGTLALAWTSPESDDDTMSIAWGDWDGDGDIDLAAGNQNQHSRVYRNDGGVLTSAWTTAAPDATVGVAWGDWDGDGDLDLATANHIQPIKIYANTGTSLTSAWTSAEVNATTDVAWGDWDGDGDLDLAVANLGEPNRVYRNEGGALTLAWTSEESDRTLSVAWGDWDGDGDLDLAAANNGNQPNRVYRNDGGALTLAWTSEELGDTASVAWGDWDSDRDLDLAVANVFQLSQVYRNDGGALTSAWVLTDSTQTESAAWGDWDGDGDLDLAAGNNNSPIRVYRNDGGVLTSAWSSGLFDSTLSVAWGDWDGDGDLDLAAGNLAQPNKVYRNDGGTLTLAWTAPITEDTYSVAWGDWDGDGDLDLAVGNSELPNRVYRNDGGVLTSAWTSAGAERTSSVAWGDWDGDGDLDLAAGNFIQPNRVYANGWLARPGRLPETPVSPVITDRPGLTAAAAGFSAECLNTATTTLNYQLVDEESDPARRVRVEYAVDGTRWLPATAAGGDGTANLAAGPSGVPHTFVWNNLADGVLQAQEVRMRIAVPIQASTHIGGPIQRAAMSAVSPPFSLCLPYEADLEITKTDDVTLAAPGGSLTYTIVASNVGRDKASGSTVSDIFPAGLSCNWTCLGAGGGLCTASGSGYLSDTVDLPPGGSVTYTVSCTISTTKRGLLSNTATVAPSAGVVDVTPDNNSATDNDTFVTPLADLGITKTDGVTRLELGQRATYTITASNAGPNPVIGATMQDHFPAALSDCSWTCRTSGIASCRGGGPAAALIDSPTLGVGSSATYEVSCHVHPGTPTGTAVVNTATIAAPSGTLDLEDGNNSATDIDEIVYTTTGWGLYTVPPCRLLDTRTAAQGPALTSGVDRLVVAVGSCGIPSSARAIAVNLTAIGATSGGQITAYPADTPMPGTSAISFSAGQARANIGILPLALDGSGGIRFQPVLNGGGTVHLSVDVVAYLE